MGKKTAETCGAILLAGGQSSRMGQEKGLASLCGRPMIAHVLAAVLPLVSEVLIVANDPRYADLGYRVVPDEFREMGPVAGLCTGLRHAKANVNFVLSCDIPRITTALLRHLLDQMGAEDAIAAATEERKQPLVSIYRREMLPYIVENLAANRLRMDQALAAAGGSFYTFPGTFAAFDPDSLRNINTPEDLAAIDCRHLR